MVSSRSERKGPEASSFTRYRKDALALSGCFFCIIYEMKNLYALNAYKFVDKYVFNTYNNDVTKYIHFGGNNK